MKHHYLKTENLNKVTDTDTAIHYSGSKMIMIKANLQCKSKTFLILTSVLILTQTMI